MSEAVVCWSVSKRGRKSEEHRTLCCNEYRAPWSHRRVAGYTTRVVMAQTCFTKTPARLTCKTCLRLLIELLTKKLEKETA